jgi:hypothetical protein
MQSGEWAEESGGLSPPASGWQLAKATAVAVGDALVEAEVFERRGHA